MRKGTLRVIDAFASRKAHDDRDNILSTDGTKLHQSGMGGQQLAVWRGKVVHWVGDHTTRFQDQVMRRLSKRGVNVEIHGLKFQTGGDVQGDQWNGWIRAHLPNQVFVGMLHWRQYDGEYDIMHVEVAPGYRRTGIATALYRKLFADQGIFARDLKPAMKTKLGSLFRKGARI